MLERQMRRSGKTIEQLTEADKMEAFMTAKGEIQWNLARNAAANAQLEAEKAREGPIRNALFAPAPPEKSVMNGKGKPCSICLEPVLENVVTIQSVAQTNAQRRREGVKCGHKFHKPCLKEWTDRGNPTCPECRNIITRIRPGFPEPIASAAAAPPPPPPDSSDLDREDLAAEYAKLLENIQRITNRLRNDPSLSPEDRGQLERRLVINNKMRATIEKKAGLPLPKNGSSMGGRSRTKRSKKSKHTRRHKKGTKHSRHH
jgi:hypothetical protein